MDLKPIIRRLAMMMPSQKATKVAWSKEQILLGFLSNALDQHTDRSATAALVGMGFPEDFARDVVEEAQKATRTVRDLTAQEQALVKAIRATARKHQLNLSA